MFEEPGGSSGHSLVAGSIHETRAGDVNSVPASLFPTSLVNVYRAGAESESWHPQLLAYGSGQMNVG